ncbi:MAG: hypothetical protein KC777_04390 [Cyanobacteria bacterium HKST-UBA02]|nr:hypothetical protein [Cyanobacteria bacterium HKST-UBA02]
MRVASILLLLSVFNAGPITPALAAEKERYMLCLSGRCKSIQEVRLNEFEVLGGPVLSVLVPLDVSKKVRAGLNTLKVRCRPDPDPRESLRVVLERRAPGPKKEKVASLTMSAREGEEKSLESEVAFNIVGDSALEDGAGIKLVDSDRQAIRSLVDDYLKAVREHDIARLRKLFAPALKEESRYRPESADYYKSSLNNEIAFLSRGELDCPESGELELTADGDRVIASRKDAKPFYRSSEPESVDLGKIAGIADDTSSRKPVILKKTRIHIFKDGDRWQMSLESGL